MAIFLAFLRKYWLQILIMVAIAGGIMYVNHLRNTVREQEIEIGTLTVQRDALQESNNKLVASIGVTNKAIEELGKTSVDTKKQFTDLNTKVSTQSDLLSAKVRKILAEKKPVSCEETIRYLIDAKREYNQ